MKRKRISDTISNLNEGVIEEATTFQKTKANKHAVWIKWTAVIACFALVMAIGIPVINNLIITQDKEATDTAWMIQYDNAYYEIIEDNPKALKKFGINPKGITSDLAGKHISFLRVSVAGNIRNDLVASEEKTDMELLEYKPANNKAHIIFRNGEDYYIARFCNYLNPDDVSYPVSEAFEIYGIYTADDIKSIASTSTDNTWKITEDIITDKNVITAFYNEMIGLKHYSEGDYHNLAFASHLKEAENNGSADAEIYKLYADDLCVLVIETVDGIRFTIDYFPSYKWIHFSETQTYCQMTSAMEHWFSNNIK